MKTPSCEQNNILNSVRDGNSVIVDSVAGSGKTTTNLWIAKSLPKKSILLLTYNRRLRIETKTKIIQEKISNMDVHTYHSFCVRYFNKKCFTDEGIEKFFKSNKKFSALSKFLYDIVIIDEAQDMTELYFTIVIHIIRLCSKKPSQLCVLGDVRQSIYEFKNADYRFLSRADSIFQDLYNNWKRHTLHETFRLNSNMTNFINNTIFKDSLMISSKPSDVKPKYIICDVFSSGERSCILREIRNLLKIYNPEDFFVISPSVKNPKCPLRQVANELSNMGINIFVPVSDDEKLDDDLVKGKMVFSTFHQTKGLERKVVLIFTFDSSYFKLYDRDKCQWTCPNVLYVALTRSTERLYMIHHYENNYLPFLYKSRLSEFADVIQDKIVKVKPHFNNNKTQNTAVTDLIRHMSPKCLNQALSYLEITTIRPSDYMIDVPNKIEQKTTCENVSDITGIAVPTYYEFKQKGTMTILEELKKSNFMPSNKINTKQCCILDSDDEDDEEETVFEEDFEKIENLLKLSNQWNAFVSGYNHKLTQIKNYNWLTRTALDQCIDRFKSLNLSECAQFEVKFETEGYPELCFRRLGGFVDCIDKDNLYEFKCVSNIESEHIIQTALYMYLHHREKLLSKNYNYYIFNILTGEMKQIRSSIDNLILMVGYLFETKYLKTGNLQTDQEFDKTMRDILGVIL